MVPSLIARVDGLPVSLLDRKRVWPAPSGAVGPRADREAARADRAPDARSFTSAGCRRGRRR